MEEPIEHNLLQTDLRQKGYYVSTGYRRSSAALAPDLWFYETLIWTAENGSRKKLVYSEDSGSYTEDAYPRHIQIVDILITDGLCALEETDNDT